MSGEKKRPQSLIAVAICSVLGFTIDASSGGALAQSEPAASPQPTEQIETVVVSARKVNENMQSTPVAVTSVSGEALESKSINRLEDLSTVVPNLQLTTASAAGDGAFVYIRGIGPSSSSLYADSPVAVYIDGVLIPHGAGLSFDLPDIDHVEVLRGPQGTLFGRNTTGGSVNIFTTTPTEDFSGSQVLSFGSLNQLVSKTVLNSGEIGDTGLRAKVTYSHDQNDGFARAPGYDRSDWAGSRNENSASGELMWDKGGKFTADYRFDGSHSDSRNYAQFELAGPVPTAYYNQSPGLGGAPFVISTHYLGLEYLDPRLPANQVETSGHELTLNYDFSEALDIKSITAYRTLNQNLYPQFMGSANLLGPVINPSNPAQPIEPVGPFVNLGEPGHQKQWSEELQASGKLGSFTYVVGFFYFYENIHETLPADITFVLSDTTALQLQKTRTYTDGVNSYAGYSQVSYRPELFDEKLEVTGGLRYTIDDKTLYEFDTSSEPPSPLEQNLKNTWSNLSGSGDVSYQWTPTLMSYGRISSAYKAGGYNPGSLQPAYAPEKATAYEVGLKSDWLDERLRANIALFDTEYNNLQIGQFNGVTGASEIVNAAAARYTGGEFELTALLGDYIQVNGSVGYVDPKFLHYYNVDGDGNLVDVASIAKVPSVSKVTAQIGVSYDFPHYSFGDIDLGVDYAYRSKENSYTLASQSPLAADLPIDPLTDLGAHITLSKTPASMNGVSLQMELFGRNLLNQHQRMAVTDFGTSLAIATGYYTQGATVGVKLSANF